MDISPARKKLGKCWIEAVKNFAEDESSFLRGLYYQNDGNVRQVSIVNSDVVVKVKGTTSSFYQSRFRFKPVDEDTKEKIKNIISESPEIAVELNEGVLSDSFLEILEANDINIFPKSLDEIESYCSCPDTTVPCKHLYAAFVEFTKEIEKRPFIYLYLRGISLHEILSTSGAIDTLEEKNKKNLVNHLVSVDKLSKNIFKIENYSNIEKHINLQFPMTDIDKLFVPLQPHPDFYKIGEFKSLFLKIHSSITENLEVITKNNYYTTYKNADFYFYYNEESELKGFVTPSSQFLYYLRSKGSRVKFSTEFMPIPVYENNEIVFAKKEGVVVSPDIIFDYFLEVNDKLFEEDNSISSKFLGYTKHLALELIKSASFQPDLVIENNQKYYIRYIPVANGEFAKKEFEFYKSLMPLNFMFKEYSELLLDNKNSNDVLSLFLTHIIEKIVFLSPVKQKNNSIINLFVKNKTTPIFTEADRALVRSISNWLDSIDIKNKHLSFVIRVEFDKEQTDDSDKRLFICIDVVNKDNPLDHILSFKDIFDENINEVFGVTAEQARIELIKQIKLAANFMPLLNEILDSRGEAYPSISLKGLLDLISNTSSVLNNLGVKVIIPKELRNIVTPKISIRAKQKKNSSIIPGETMSYLSLNDLMEFSYEIAIGDAVISGDEFKKLVTSADEIVKYKDKYLLLKPDEVNLILEQIKNPPPQFSSNLDLIHSALTGVINDIEFNYDDAIQRIIDDVTRIEDIDIPKNLIAELRPYQVRGFKWLYSNAKKGFGSCIADDMGLGKTIQVIALILKLKEEEKLKKPVVVVCPTTLVGNWLKECVKFAPSLSVAMYHGTDRKLVTEGVDLLITTYGLLRQDLEEFKDKEWSILVIDEAQNIKNNDTGQTIAVKTVKAHNYIAMSGTPVENRLTELWSIFDFTNKGYLGGVNDFQHKYSLPIEKYRDEEKIDKLKLATSPFILRRLKNDKTIINDLPDKIAFDEYCYLTKEQAALYENVLESTMKNIETSEGINRRGNILKLITALKQICNHPAHFTKKDKLTKELSGKTEKVFSILENILEQKEKVLIFTQYKEMGDILQTMIKNELLENPLFFHGSIPRSKRDAIVDKFQTDEDAKIMIVSLKAGGTGLNLTAATNVIHYDLWWNPAVEDQATDRAYRIGQEKNVIVHRMITLGTFEEKIDEIIKSKKELASLTVSTGEKWITELSNQDLRDIFSLSR